MKKNTMLRVLSLSMAFAMAGSLTVTAAEGFDAAYYAANNPDVVAAYGDDAALLELHYNTFGRAEGRAANTEGAGAQAATGLEALFDAAYYASQNPDVVAAVGNDAAALYAHFVNFGMQEGRAPSEAFQVSAYKAANPDLAAAFGDDIVAYYNHYLTVGKAEGRVTAPVKKTEVKIETKKSSGGGGGSSSSSTGSNSGSGEEHCHNYNQIKDNGDGTHTATCSCGDSYTQNCADSISLIEETPATCTAAGKGKTVCSVCSHVINEDYEIPALGHDYEYTSNDNGTHNGTCKNSCGVEVTDEACDELGDDGACSKCGYKAATTDPAHVCDLQAATSNNNGTHTITCNGAGSCDKGYPKTEDCDKDGSDGACSKCGYSDGSSN